MKKVTVELDYDTVDNIVIEQLIISMNTLKQDSEKRNQGKCGPIFRKDFVEDMKEIDSHLESFMTVLSYYGHNMKTQDNY